MPTYAYQCEACGNAIEVFQKMSDAPLTVCEPCGGDLKKKMFPVGIVFKGSGFYVNDYAKKDAGTSTTAAATAASETSTAPATASDSKPAETKAESKPTESKGEAAIKHADKALNSM